MDEKGGNYAGVLQQSAGDGVVLDVALPRALELVDLEAAGRRITVQELWQRVGGPDHTDIIATSYLGVGQDGLSSGDFTALHPHLGNLSLGPPQQGDGAPVQGQEEDGEKVDEPAPPENTPTPEEDRYLLRLAINYVSLVIKISHHGIFGTTWVAAEAAVAMGLGGGDHGRLSLVIILLGLLVAGLVLHVLLTAALGERAAACSRRYQVILLCVAVSELVLTVIVMALRVISASYLATSLLRSTLTRS